jgi:hypothetical protein
MKFALFLALGILVTAPSHADVLQGLIDAAPPVTTKNLQEELKKYPSSPSWLWRGETFLIPRNAGICDPEKGNCRNVWVGIVVKLWSKSEEGWCLVVHQKRDWNLPKYPVITWTAYVRCDELIHLPQDMPTY